VLTIKSAAQLLAGADSLDALLPIVRLLGYSGDPLHLTSGARRDLAVHDLARAARLVSGPGALRCLIAQLRPPLDLGPALDLRERTRLLASSLLRQAPTRLWLVAALEHDGHTLCLATVTDSPHGPRVAALRLDRRRVLDSDADTLRALAAITEDDPLLRHARYSDILRRDALTLRFYRALEQAVAGLADSLAPAPRARRAPAPTVDERRELALLCTSRLLFLAFLEAKGWLDDRRDFLLHHTLRALEQGGSLHDRLLRPLFFGTLNTPRTHRAPVARAFGQVPFLNGGLFTPTTLEKRRRPWHFSDDALTALTTGVLDRYRFTAREDSNSWSEAAVDPEMLGRAFESLMSTDERRRSGSFYTPPHLVSQVVRDALQTALPGLPSHLLDDHGGEHPLPSAAAATRLRDAVLAMRVLDPACGSGAFLVHTLERFDRLLAATGDTRPSHLRRRELLTRTIFGVDRQPLAVWLCELRLWLSVVIDCHEPDISRIAPLPNLDHHIRVGDSLAGGTFDFVPPGGSALTRLRTRYVRSSGRRKQAVAQQLDQEERHRALAELDRRHEAVRHEREALLQMLRARDLFGQRRRVSAVERARASALRDQARALITQRRRLAMGAALPFRFGTMFADVAAQGGFTLVLGNPPWVRPHAMPVAERQWLRLEFRSMRHASWLEGAARAGAGTGFAAQADLAVAFIERSLQLLAPAGTLALLVPAKLWRTLSGGGVRRLLLGDAQLRAVYDWSDAPAQFDAATYPSLVVATRGRTALRETLLPSEPWPTPEHAAARPSTRTASSASDTPVQIAIVRRHTTRFVVPPAAISLGGDPGAPWVLLPPPAHAAFETLRRSGTPLAATAMGRPLLGVKCGCNAAFLASGRLVVPRQGVIERTLLRPALRGEAIGRASRRTASSTGTSAAAHEALRIVWTHDPFGAPLKSLPPATTRWLAHWRPRLSARKDARHRQPWWTLFRTEAANHDLARVVWADIGRQLRTEVLRPGDPTVPLNSCYVVRTPSLDDAFALSALLQSTIAGAWLDCLAEPARGGFRRYLGWTVAAFPVPVDWRRAAALLAPYGRAFASGAFETNGDALAELDETVAHAYAVPISELFPLLDWYRQ
jgi:SAM-dependent methyltransferase